MNTAEVRQEIDRLVATGDAVVAARTLGELWRAESSAASAAFLVSRFERLRAHLGLLPYRVSILRSFTVEPIVPLLRALAFQAGIDLDVHLSEFNAHVLEILDPDRGLYRFAPDVVILAVQTRDVIPELWDAFPTSSAQQIQKACERALGEFQSWIRGVRQHSRAHLIVHNLEQPGSLSSGLLDAQSLQGQSAAIQRINRELCTLAAEHGGVYLLDYDALVSRHGRVVWHDEHKWLSVCLPISAASLIHMAREWMRFLHPFTGKIAKAVAVDLDDTLWGGVIGEDGLSGIQLGPEYPGAAYQGLQRALLDLRCRGILLAVCSKNNQAEALEAIERHPGMLLKPGDFSAIRVNWRDKSQNLREIAAELNIGLDALALLDDNPFERQQVRAQLPEVLVIDVPDNPMEFADTVRTCPMFERLAISQEDQQRGAHYQAQRQRAQLESEICSREDFYRSLRQEAEVAPVTKATLARMAQLTNKTNQFNLTTRRYTEQEISGLCASPGWDCFSIRVKDRFGDNGLVGVAITQRQGDACEIDTFLLSCRVIGRTVETAFLSFLAQHAHEQGARRLQGWFRPTKKNVPARDFYLKHGFVAVEQNGGGTLWQLDLSADAVRCPEWIRLHVVNGERKRLFSVIEFPA